MRFNEWEINNDGNIVFRTTRGDDDKIGPTVRHTVVSIILSWRIFRFFRNVLTCIKNTCIQALFSCYDFLSHANTRTARVASRGTSAVCPCALLKFEYVARTVGRNPILVMVNTRDDWARVWRMAIRL